MIRIIFVATLGFLALMLVVAFANVQVDYKKTEEYHSTQVNTKDNMPNQFDNQTVRKVEKPLVKEWDGVVDRSVLISGKDNADPTVLQTSTTVRNTVSTPTAQEIKDYKAEGRYVYAKREDEPVKVTVTYTED